MEFQRLVEEVTQIRWVQTSLFLGETEDRTRVSSDSNSTSYLEVTTVEIQASTTTRIVHRIAS